MSLSEWSLVVGSALSIGLTVGPWMFKVHAKLAVIASKVVDLCELLDDTREEHRRLRETCSRHESRLDSHDVQLAHVAERLRAE